MTIANAITSSRILVAPFFFIAFFLPRWTALPVAFPVVVLWALFALMEISDLADGAVARKLGQTSDTGKLLDPFADSLSRLTYFFCFTTVDIMPIWIFLVILYRDLGVGFVRLLVLKRGAAMSARVSGKLKAWIYAVSGIAGLLVFTLQHLWSESSFLPAMSVLASITFYLAGAIALWTLYDYVSVLFRKNNRKA
jgi:CDP-diacylglycerol---glycerol-3-phosphate 3-phosphatidyltransferase